MYLSTEHSYSKVKMFTIEKEFGMYDHLEVKVISSFVGGYTMTNYYLFKATYQMMAYDLCLKGEHDASD